MSKFWWYLVMVILNVVGLTVESIALIQGNYISAMCAMLNLPCFVLFVVSLSNYVSNILESAGSVGRCN